MPRLPLPPPMRSWSDYFLPAALRGDEEVLRRARLTIPLSTVLVGAAVAYAAFYALIGFEEGAVILTAGAALAGVALALLRLRPWPGAGGHVLTCVLYGVLVAMMCYEGGLRGLITPWLITPPIFAILLLGRRGAVAWTALCVLTIVAFHVLESRGVRFPVAYPDAWAARITIGSHTGLVMCTAVLLFVFEDIRANAQARAESASAALARLAYHDALTGLANRARFLECLDVALARAHAAGDAARVAVLLLDLDGFKAVNDSMGHAAGDALLAEVAARLLNATRGCDTVARLGGDEFAVLLDGVRHDGDTSVVADRIVASIAAPFGIGDRAPRIGVSVGIARASTAPIATADVSADDDDDDAARAPRGVAAAVLHDADVAMYRAKALGRGRWVRFAPGMAAEPPEPAAAPRLDLARPQLGVA